MIVGMGNSWLPDCAFLGPESIAEIDDCLQIWGEQWLAKDCLCAGPLWRVQSAQLLQESTDREEGLTIQCRPEARLQFASLLLAREVEEKHMRSQQDRSLIDHVVDAAVSGLSAALGNKVSGASQDSESKFYTLDIGIKGNGGLLTLSVSQARLIALAHSRAPRPRSSEPAVPLIASLAEQEITIASLLGSSILNLAEVKHLQIGDVIVLEQAADKALDLTINGQKTAEASVSILTADKSHTLKIERSADQW